MGTEAPAPALSLFPHMVRGSNARAFCPNAAPPQKATMKILALAAMLLATAAQARTTRPIAGIPFRGLAVLAGYQRCTIRVAAEHHQYHLTPEQLAAAVRVQERNRVVRPPRAPPPAVRS